MTPSQALSHAIEMLEPRRLLTTLHGGDTFSFLQAGGQIEVVQLTGNVTAEVIGARYTGGNSVSLVNLAGSLNGTSVNGGIGANNGTQGIGIINITDPTVPDGSQDTTAAAISALALDSTGRLFGVNIKTITEQGPLGPRTVNLLQIVLIDKTTATGTVVAEVSTQALTLAGTDFDGATPQITAATAAAFNPVDGRLYFVANGGTSNIPKLFSIDVTSSVRTTVEGSLQTFAGTFGAIPVGASTGGVTVVNIGGLVFDSLGANTVRLLGGINLSGTATSSRVFTVDLTNTNNIQGAVTPTLPTGQFAGTITGLALAPDAAGAAPTVLVLDSNGAASALLSVSTTTGAATNLGPLAAGQAQGQNPGDLTFDPNVLDPFTGQQGALYGTDTVTGALFFVNPVSHVAQPNAVQGDFIFSIYVSSSDETGAISVYTVDPTTGVPAPFTGSIGTLGVTNAQSGALVSVAAPANSGAALLGARVLPPQNPVAGVIYFEPILTANVGQTFGVLDPSIITLHAGLIVAPGNNLGKFLFGGTVLGEVQIHGSINQFYAGWLLTGNSNGEESAGIISDPRNFQVDGNIRNLIVAGSIGTDVGTGLASPTYLSGFDLHVNGTIGNVTSGDSIIGSANADHNPNVVGPSTNQTEIELKGGARANPLALSTGVSLGEAVGGKTFDNDTFATPQYLSSSPNATLQSGTDVVVDGVLQDNGFTLDKVDYYAVPLLAGQVVTVQLTQLVSSSLPLDVAVFDPSGREIASDYNAVDTSQTQQKAFTVTATTPGVYRFAVAAEGNSTFVATQPATGPAATIPFEGQSVPYTLSIKNVGDLGFGNLVAAKSILDNPNLQTASPGFGAANGDFGSVTAGTNFLSLNLIPSNTIIANNGNLRSVSAANIGTQVVNSIVVGNDPQINVPRGSVGLVQATAVGGILLFNDTSSAPPAIGGDYQIIDSAGNLGGKFYANRAIGTIRAQSIAVDGANSQFFVNRDNLGDDGTIDLIDVTNNLGDLNFGGPGISTGPKGNVRYMHVGGSVFRDPFFGGGLTTTDYGFGNSATVVDDSGALLTFSPISTVQTTVTTATGNGTTATGTTTTTVTNADGSTTTTVVTIASTTNGTVTTTVVTTDAQISITAYGIEGSGGSAIVNATSTGGITVTGSGTTAEIGTLETTQTLGQPTKAGSTLITITNSAGTVTVTTTASGTVQVPSLPTLDVSSTTAPLNVSISGSARVDVFDLRGKNFSSISNNTKGEIVDVHASSVGSLTSGGSIGVPSSNTAATIEPVATEFLATNGQPATTSTYPFLQQHFGVDIGATVGSGNNGDTGDDLINLSAPIIGNIRVGGQIGTISGTEEGPIVGGGAINSVNVRTGILPSGTGNFAKAGIFATGVIGTVNSDVPATIRGDIISKEGIIAVNISGSIINAVIGLQEDFSTASALNQNNGTVPQAPVSGKTVINNIGTISTGGNGGIIGSKILGDKIGAIAAHGGFGIFDTNIITIGGGIIGNLTADGYGIRGVTFFGGASIGAITATGNGSLSSVANYSAQVRYSETSAFDPFFGSAPTELTDLNLNLGTTAATPVIPNVTDTGVIADSVFIGSGNLGSVRAYQIRAADPVNAPVQFNFANSVGSVTTTSTIDGMQLTTGKLSTFAPGGDVLHSSLIIAGGIKKLVLKGNFRDSSTIHAIGKNGNITSLTVLGDMDGTIQADGGKITTAKIVGALSGAIIARSLGSLTLNGSLGNGSLQVTGNVSTINATGNLGKTGDTLTINGTLGTLKVGGNLYANVNVLKNFTRLTLKGSLITGATISVAQTFSALTIGGDFQAGSTIKAHKIKSKKIKGAILGNFVIV